MIYKLLMCFLLLSLLNGCFNKDMESPYNSIAVVDSLSRFHHGKGLLETEVYYSFVYKDSLIKGAYSHRFDTRYSSMFDIGDSLLIVFDREDYENNEFVRIIDKNKAFRKL